MGTDNDSVRPRRGRPRSEASRQAVLAAAGDLMLEGGLAAATMDAIAARAGVSKATIYKWWRSRGAVALEGFLTKVATAVSVPEGASLEEALRTQVGTLVGVFRTTAAGSLMRALAGEAVSNPDIGRALREQWFAPRRAVIAELLRGGVERGELRADLDVAAAVDQLFAPVYQRLIFGHEPLDTDLAGTLVAQAVNGFRPAAGSGVVGAGPAAVPPDEPGTARVG